MKKQYVNPTLDVVFIEDADIVTSSVDVTFGENKSGVSAGAKQRENIWDE